MVAPRPSRPGSAGAPRRPRSGLPRWLLDHAAWCWVFTALTLALALLGATRLQIDFSSASFYGAGSPGLVRFQAFLDRWGADDRTLVVVGRTDDAGGILRPDRLRVLEELAEALARDPDVERATSVGSLRPTPSAPSIATSAERLGARAWSSTVAPALRTDDRLVPLFLSRDGGATAVLVELRSSSDDLGATRTVIERLRPIVSAHARLGLELELAGIPALRAAFFSLVLRDQAVLVPTTALLVGLGLWLTFRRSAVVVVLGCTAGLPLLLLLGLMGWSGEPIGLLNQAYFTLLPVIALADGVHLVARAEAEHRAGLEWRAAVERAVGRIGWACLLTSLTTGFGFASLALAEMPILRSFGLYAAAGVTLAYGVVLVIGPLLLVRLPPPEPGPPPRWLAAVPRLAEVALRRPVAVLLGAAVLTVLAWIGASRVVVDNRLSDLLLPEHPVAAANRVLDRSLGGSLALELELTAAPGTWNDDDARLALDRAAAALRALAPTRVVLTPSQLPALVLPEGDVARLSVRVSDMGARAFEGFAAAAVQTVRAVVPPEVAVEPTGTAWLAYRGVNRITDDLRASLGSVFAVITCVLGLLFRSVPLAAISILPNALPLLFGYAGLGWSGTALDPLATVVLTFALGIAVDDTIHILTRFREEAAGCDGPEALRRAIAHSGTAVTVTSWVLAVGLAANLSSSFPPLRLLGGLGAAVILWAWLCDLLVLPASLMLLDRWRGRPRPAPAPPPESAPAGAATD